MKKVTVEWLNYLERLSPRERLLSGILLGIFVGILILIYQVIIGGTFEELETDRRILEDKLVEIREMAPKYLEARQRYEQLMAKVKSNDIVSVRIPLNEIAKRIEYEGDISGATGNRLADIISFEGQTVKTPIFLRPRSRKAKKKAKPDLIKIEQTANFREVPVKAFLKFIDEIQRSGKLLWVTKVSATRRFNNMEHVRASITVATLKLPGEEEL